MPRIIRVLSRLPTAFRMAVNMVLRREDAGLVCRLRMNVKDPRFLVVDPDDGVRHDLILVCKTNRGTVGSPLLQGRRARRRCDLKSLCVLQTIGSPRHGLEPWLFDGSTVNDAGAEGAIGHAAQRV